MALVPAEETVLVTLELFSPAGVLILAVAGRCEGHQNTLPRGGLQPW